MKAKYVFDIIQRSYHELTATSKGDVEWLFHETDECVIIAFRGTETKRLGMLRDVIRNALSLIPWKHKDLGWVSFGYLRGATNAVADLYKFLESKGHLEKPVILCGHSMGGAISYMCAKMMDADGVPIHSWVGTGVVNCVITTQRPKFKCFNFRYQEDIISVFPFKFLGFKQPCEYIQIGHDNSKNNPFDIGDVNDHKMVVYLEHAPDMNIMEYTIDKLTVDSENS